MKILVFYQYFGTPNGSWSTRIYELCKRWVESGHEVTVVTSPYEKSDIKAEGFISKQDVEGIKLIVINSADSNKQSFLTRVFKACLFSLISVWYALTEKYDICLVSSGPITIGLPMIFAKKIRQKKTVFEVRDLWPAGAIELGLLKSEFQKKMALRFEKSCYKNADLIVAASVGQKKHILTKAENKNVLVIPNASDINLFGSLSAERLPNWTDDKILLTHIGSLGLIHNINYWMLIAEEILRKDMTKKIHLLFIGDGADKEQLLRIKETKGLTNVHFLGLMPKKNLPVWVQNSAATLFATLANPVQSTCSPNKIFDSFAASKPIIQTTEGWIKDLVNEYNCGINIDLDNPQEAALKILQFVLNKDALKLTGENAKRLAEQEFNRDILATRYLNTLINLK